MDKKKIFLFIQSGLCVLWTVLMAASAIRIYSEGAAYAAQGHPEAWIYTSEKAMAVFGACAPVLLAAVAMTIAGAVLGIRDEKQDRPAADPELIRIYKAEREAVPDHERETAKNRTLNRVRAAVFALAAVFIIAGILNGSMEDMLIKAINICSECIGLG